MYKHLINYFSEFKVLKTTTKDFWFINIMQFFELLGYFSMITVITLYLTQNGGFSDFDSGKWVSIYTLFITAFIFAVGSICDIIGLKRSLFIALLFLVLGRGGLGLAPIIFDTQSGIFTWFDWGSFSTTAQSWGDLTQYTIIASLLVLSFGTAFLGPVTQTALRRFTTKENRATGFNLYYLFMNIGAIMANFFIVGMCRDYFGPTEGNLWIINIGFASTIIAFFLGSTINENNYAEESERLEKQDNKRPLSVFLEVWGERPFQKLVLLLFLTIGVRLVFTHQFLVMPKYYTRVLYEDFDLGPANTINPIIIVTGLILLIPIINKYSTIKLMILGMSISASSLILMCLPLEWVMSLPFIETVSGAYLCIILSQIILFSVGELIFMPRFTEYIASVAPKEKVASYMSLAALPMFIAKPINGFLSGVLISMFCYDGIRAKIDTDNIAYGQSPEFMWLIYCILAVVSPLAVIGMKRFLEQKKEDYEKTAKGVEEAGYFLEPAEQEIEGIITPEPTEKASS